MEKKLMTMSEMIRSISELTDVPLKTVKSVLAEYETILASELLDKGAVRVGLLGSMKVKVRSQRIAMDLKTNERIIVPAKVQPKFVFSKAIKDLVAENVPVENLQDKK
ncbi:MAG: HU family DNA-binding protein [Ureaplasma sp.]|nr:HU family DNA-binding protein [Ureaplasma sp.]MDE6289503.1 HU family DNA-binding protein [Ureaplasma sp.]